MKRHRNIINFVVTFIALFLIMSIDKTAYASTQLSNSLKEINLNNSYYITDIIQHKNKTFILGRGINEENDKLAFVVKEGDKTSILIPSFEPSNTSVRVFGESSSSIYLKDKTNIYIVDKNTNEVKKELKEAFVKPFVAAAEKNGYSEYYPLPNGYYEDAPMWDASLATKNGERVPVLVNRNGFVVALSAIENTYTVAVDNKGAALVFDASKGGIRRIDLQGNEALLKFPQEIVADTAIGVLKFFCDKDDNIYFLNQNHNLTILTMDKEELKVAKTYKGIDDLYQSSFDKKVYYLKNISGDSTQGNYNYILGAIDKYANLNDKYSIRNSRLGFWFIDDKISVYDENALAIYADKDNKYGVYSGASEVTLKGWVNRAGKWYYYDLTTGQLKTGWFNDSINWYYLDGNGEMKTGWLSYNGQWYFLQSNGVMKTGWLKDGDKWYYLYNTGIMAKNTVIEGCKLGKDGYWIP